MLWQRRSLLDTADARVFDIDVKAFESGSQHLVERDARGSISGLGGDQRRLGIGQIALLGDDVEGSRGAEPEFPWFGVKELLLEREILHGGQVSNSCLLQPDHGV